MKTVAYLRVSTAQQDLRSQRLAILEYAQKHDFRIDDFIEAVEWVCEPFRFTSAGRAVVFIPFSLPTVRLGTAGHVH